jgi:hypothetical protein
MRGIVVRERHRVAYDENSAHVRAPLHATTGSNATMGTKETPESRGRRIVRVSRIVGGGVQRRSARITSLGCGPWLVHR